MIFKRLFHRSRRRRKELGAALIYFAGGAAAIMTIDFGMIMAERATATDALLTSVAQIAAVSAAGVYNDASANKLTNADEAADEIISHYSDSSNSSIAFMTTTAPSITVTSVVEGEWDTTCSSNCYTEVGPSPINAIGVTITASFNTGSSFVSFSGGVSSKTYKAVGYMSTKGPVIVDHTK